MGTAAKFCQFRGAERAGDGNRMEWEGRRDVGMPRDKRFRTHPVRRSVERLILITFRSAENPPLLRGTGIAGFVVSAIGRLFTRQAGEPQKCLIRREQGMRGLDGN